MARNASLEHLSQKGRTDRGFHEVGTQQHCQPGPAEVGGADLFVRGLRPFGVAFDDRDVTVDGQICKSLSFTTG